MANTEAGLSGMERVGHQGTNRQGFFKRGKDMKRGTRDKAIAGIGTIWVMSLITTNAQPKLWQIAFFALGLYEVMQMTVRIARRHAYKERKRRYITVNKRNGRNLEEMQFGWKMKEVGM